MTSAALKPLSVAPARDRAASRPRIAVRRWLFLMAALVVAMVAVGGATRLTGSGLSITEWKPVTGAVPPLSAEAWAEEFAKYRATPQYDILNRGMSLAEFQVIYAWEWGHRFLGRLIGLCFFLPLGWFWWTGRLDRRLGLGLVGLGVLGGLQGAVGWIMVASGLQPGMVAVAPIKLAAHLTLASAIFAGLVWLAAGLDRPAEAAAPRRLRLTALLLPVATLLQIALGGLVAGSKAGLTYNTWPLMDGAFIPPVSGLFAATPWIENFVDNVALVQLNHRLVAYALLALALLHALDARRARPGSGAARRAAALAGLVAAQAMLGITTLLLAVPLWAGLAHQVTAMLVLGMAVAHARIGTLARG
ncbi:cytochrome oxidase assembly [Methylobacterium sp. 4-46]|uniref:Heme A synthase n=1 Tax=Methylobacterium sp. (strain 4-46) TaxID=426117 RepID=CTAA_METS4|nr:MULTISPECIES: COX15/CtaA family protein [Methylobacterium]B0UR12.1 RecName: Full=Heme A synthase; Short=HAS; AltName: Full=Cytochrome aa3-controlling protein [Methylobacterium sp. 4-46]ACA19685.1 cytochrome oxidase assembly [Methylobacterium sp. 4-46]WFT78882.1 COX15/CtaA family protein [Methylobacterium nodulans]